MRIIEIASAEEQIELWKLVSNSVWQSLQQQQSVEQKRQAQLAASRPQRKPKGGQAVKGMPIPKLPMVPVSKPTPAVKQPPPAKTSTGAAPYPNDGKPQEVNRTAGATAQSPVKKMPLSPSQVQRQAGNTKEDERQNAIKSDPLGVMDNKGRIKTSQIRMVSR